MKKKLDPSIQELITTCVKNGHRSFFVLVGDHGKDQVENLHRILCNARVKARPSVLWCYKKELGFSTHKQKRMKEIKRDQKRGLHDPDRDDPFELFITTTNIRWTYYKDTDKVLGQTFGAVVLQDFEAVTPNVLARTIETVEGGGMVILLLNSVKSLKQLYSLSMDVHSRFRTTSHAEVVPRFNERFILSLSKCKSCMALDDELNILPLHTIDGAVTSKFATWSPADDNGAAGELKKMKTSLEDTPILCDVVSCTRTLDQARVLVNFFDVISAEQGFVKPVVSVTAARGRGKSASLGLCLAGAVAYGYSNVFVTAPSLENLLTTFAVLLDGLKALKYIEHTDYEIVYEQLGKGSGGSGGGDDGTRHLKIPKRIDIFKKHKQTVRYLDPTSYEALSGADILAIDEAASIPLPTVKKLLGHCTTLLATTIHGYEGTGRSLSLKLMDQLRSQSGADHAQSFKFSGGGDKVASGGHKNKKGDRIKHEARWAEAAQHNASRKALHELTLTEPIRYSAGDPVEGWLDDFLCLNASVNATRLVTGVPAPQDCELFMVNRDALFSHHALSETLLQRIWSIYTTAHYKNSPNDLQVLSDAPAHRIYIMLGPQKGGGSGGPGGIPDILCVVQVAFEGKISQNIVNSELAKGSTPSGDLIPWTLSQQYNDTEFPRLSGARIVRIATHPDVTGMGYGSRAMELLASYFSGELSAVQAPAGDIVSEKKESSLLLPIQDRPAERLHWLGSSFGITAPLHKFWKRQKFEVCYVRQTINDTTGEHSAIVIRELSALGLEDAPEAGWLGAFKLDYRKRLLSMMAYTFRTMDISLALSLIDPDKEFASALAQGAEGAAESTVFREIYGSTALSGTELLSSHLTHYDLKRLELYSRNMVDYHMVMDTLPVLARLYFLGRLSDVRLSALQVSVLLACGLQHRSVNDVTTELGLPVNQVLAFFNKAIRKLSNALRKIEVGEVTARDSSKSKKVDNDKEAAVSSLASSSSSSSSYIDDAANTLQHNQIIRTDMDIPEVEASPLGSSSSGGSSSGGKKHAIADYQRRDSSSSSASGEKKKKKKNKNKHSHGDGGDEKVKRQKVG